MGGISTMLFGTKRPDPEADECAEFVIDPHGDGIPREAKDAYSRSFRAGIYTALAKHPAHGFAVIQKVMGGRHCFEWREQQKDDRVVQQSSPKNARAFIVVEGPDGVGKSRITKSIAKNLREAGNRVVETREPSGGDVGKRIRKILCGDIPAPESIEMSRLYAEDRIDHLAKVVLLALRDFVIVVCDRYLLSSIAYQHGAMGLPLADIRRFNRYAIVPDLTLVLRTSQDVCAARRKERGDAPSMFEDEETQRKIRRVYDNPFDYIESHNPVLIDASIDFDSVVENCMIYIAQRIAEVSK